MSLGEKNALWDVLSIRYPNITNCELMKMKSTLMMSDDTSIKFVLSIYHNDLKYVMENYQLILDENVKILCIDISLMFSNTINMIDFLITEFHSGTMNQDNYLYRACCGNPNLEIKNI